MTPLPPPSSKFDSASNGLVGVEFQDFFEIVKNHAKIIKLDLGTIKNGFRASDLPPEGPKKRAPRRFEQFEQSQD